MRKDLGEWFEVSFAFEHLIENYSYCPAMRCTWLGKSKYYLWSLVHQSFFFLFFSNLRKGNIDFYNIFNFDENYMWCKWRQLFFMTFLQLLWIFYKFNTKFKDTTFIINNFLFNKILKGHLILMFNIFINHINFYITRLYSINF